MSTEGIDVNGKGEREKAGKDERASKKYGIKHRANEREKKKKKRKNGKDRNKGEKFLLEPIQLQILSDITFLL